MAARKLGFGRHKVLSDQDRITAPRPAEARLLAFVPNDGFVETAPAMRPLLI
jgi:hypothetical protein